MIVCVLLEVPPEGEVLSALLESAPRAALEGSCAWLDARGVDVTQMDAAVRRRIAGARTGAAHKPAAARLAALHGAHALHSVPVGRERDFMAQHTLAELGVTDPLLGWLADVGIATCGELAAVEREAVEVRFGGGAVHWWRLARGADERRLFAPVPAEQPNASVDFIDYVVTDPERLIFTTNALLGGLCERMQERGAHARRIRLRLSLANGAVWERSLRTARPTAERTAWLRLARLQLEKLTVPDAVNGVAVQVESTEAAAALQGDLFDVGFATSSAVETAVARVLEDQGEVVLQPAAGAHPLVERRGEFKPLEVREVLQLSEAESHPAASVDVPADPGPVGLTLQLLAEPRAITVEAVQRRDHVAPVRYRDRGWHEVVQAAGPDRVSGGQWDAAFAREYFRAVTDAGTLVWLFRDAGADRWYLHGWWD